MPINEIAEQVAKAAQRAVVACGDRTDGALDYSESSLQIVEQLLAEASPHAGQMSEASLKNLVHTFGSYILEVGRREFGGRYSWYEPGNQPVLVVGEPDFRVAIITFDRVRSRVLGNLEDNIPFFFDGFSSRARKTKRGDDVFFV